MKLKRTPLIFILLLNAAIAFSQKDSSSQKISPKEPEKNSPQTPENNFTGVAVSPSTLRFSVKPGKIEVREIKITNDTKANFKFQIGYTDFVMGRNGKPLGIKPEDSKYALSKWITASPSYGEVKPGAQLKVTVTIAVPSGEDGSISAWTVMMVDQVEDRAPLNPKGNEKTLALGVLPSIGFGIYIYQNPPNVKVQNVEIEKFAYKDSVGKDSTIRSNIKMEVKNVGDGIGFCSSYVELTSLKTGKKTKLNVKQFTILPGFYRDFFYTVPADLPKGKYSAVGVVDFGNDEEVKVAELEFTMK